MPASTIAPANSSAGPTKDRSTAREGSPSPVLVGSRACTAAAATRSRVPRAVSTSGAATVGAPPLLPPPLPPLLPPGPRPGGSSRGVALPRSSASGVSVAQPHVVGSPTGVITMDPVAAEELARCRGGRPGATSPSARDNDNMLRSERVMSKRRSLPAAAAAAPPPAPPPAKGDVDREVDGRCDAL
jgi:hypothetical protein